MPGLVDRVDACIATRELAARLATQTLIGPDSRNEKSMCEALLKAMGERDEIHPSGWYNPPPGGVSALYAQSSDMRRLDFDSLRKEEFWPQADYVLSDETVGFVYLSPVDRATGMIGDYGFTFYRGANARTRQLLQQALTVTEDAAEHASVGMQFKELFDFIQKRLAKSGLRQGRMHLMYDPTGVDFGHTIPWSYEEPTATEQAAIRSQPIQGLKNVIAGKRLYLNDKETFAIPETCAFTIEPRVVVMNEKGEPDLFYYHIIVVFRDGKKYVPANFNRLFGALGMDFIRSRFDD